MTLFLIALLTLGLSWVLHRLSDTWTCAHELVWDTDPQRGKHRTCLHCAYRSPGLTGWRWRDRLYRWLETRVRP